MIRKVQMKVMEMIKAASALAVVAALAVFAGVLAKAIFTDINNKDSMRHRKYDLTAFVQTLSGPRPVGTVLVTNVEQMIDGSLCFETVQEMKHVCVKFQEYDLVEKNVK